MYLALLGYLMIITFMVLIMTKKLSALTALIVVPIAFGLIAGGGWNVAKYALDGIKGVATTFSMMVFAILYFGIMLNAGLFDPLVKKVLKIVKGDPLKVLVGTAILAAVVSLDGGTRLAMDRRKPRDVRLEGGRALFTVVHDDAHPFVVVVGQTTLTDLGTIFDVTQLQDGVRVSVSEGSVRVDAPADTATLNPGDSVIATPRGLDRRTLSPDDVAAWREGRLTYADEALGVVAQDLARALNRPITVSPALSGRRFSGSLTTRAAPEDQKGRLSRLLDVSVVDEGAGWRLEPRPAS